MTTVEHGPHFPNLTFCLQKARSKKDRHVKQPKKKILKSGSINALCGMGKKGINQGAKRHPSSSVVTLQEFSYVNLFCNLTVKMLMATYKLQQK